MAALAGDLESDIVGSVAFDLDGAGREVVEILVQQLPIVRVRLAVLCALCSMLHVLCSMLYAVCAKTARDQVCGKFVDVYNNNGRYSFNNHHVRRGPLTSFAALEISAKAGTDILGRLLRVSLVVWMVRLKTGGLIREM